MDKEYRDHVLAQKRGDSSATQAKRPVEKEPFLDRLVNFIFSLLEGAIAAFWSVCAVTVVLLAIRSVAGWGDWSTDTTTLLMKLGFWVTSIFAVAVSSSGDKLSIFSVLLPSSALILSYFRFF